RGLILGLLPEESQQPDSQLARWLVISFSVLTLFIADRAWLHAPSQGAGWELTFALNLVATLLVSYHAFVQDMSLLFMAILLVSNVLLSTPKIHDRARKALWATAAILFCAPVYLVLILVYGELSLIVWVILIFFVAFLYAVENLRNVDQPATS